ncbi:MAG TPA: hypothetical protein DCX32_03730 [Candidatus Moranbacteria bacterium]|nr:MAG: hypothetical protein UW95_C0009G0002 [Parcubacteria group bacterium GW2011_GWC1_45_14]HAV11624.1 hypothetical protein [Candidatus Moranbacteria bacterium]
MLFNVPQYIDVEDKVVGPLTVKQLLWMIAAGVLTLLMWAVLPKPVFFIIAIPEVLLFVALAFYKPYGQPLISFVFAGVMFLFGPKIYVWRRTPQKRKASNVSEEKRILTNANANNQRLMGQQERRQMALKNLSGIAKILDSEGQQSDEDVVDMLKKPEVRK